MNQTTLIGLFTISVILGPIVIAGLAFELFKHYVLNRKKK